MREVPFEVQLAGYCLDFHVHNRCAKCGPDGWCPRVAVARARIIAWRRSRRT
ncbi:hypothetical protein V6U90_09800 [Micromonospora sp. CPCC 206060]|uniref:hypothetical protein n=1 Tax=Micromonospora sp. CPCC 206060 TaxID=3122406 RepID=UPI002FF21B49